MTSNPPTGRRWYWIAIPIVLTGALVAPTLRTSRPALPEGPSALTDPSNPELPEPIISPADLVPGGPPPDGIPPIDDPAFTTVDDADAWLADTDPVVYVEVADDVHAYPVQILIWHEIVNDTIDDFPVTVTFCPLCNSAVAFNREIRGVETSFGTSGLLHASALVMYDRATESLWTQIDGTAIAGALTGTTLEVLPAPLLAWSEVAGRFPDASVLDRDGTGSSFPYGENPYVGYDNPRGVPLNLATPVDPRLAPKQRVVGVVAGDQASAWVLDELATPPASATNVVVAGEPLVILWRTGQVSAIDTMRIVSGRDVGSIGVFDRRVGTSTLTFAADGDRIVDLETGNEWDMTGSAIAGPDAGRRLTPIPHLDTFWFAWSTYYPDTSLTPDG
jgi:hypothetical protein